MFIFISAHGARFDLFAAALMSNSPRRILKAQLLCLRSGRVAARSQLCRE